MNKFLVSVWVPTKGWKLLLTTKDANKAREFAQSFEPLEVMVKECNGSKLIQNYFGGRLCQPNYDCVPIENSLNEIGRSVAST